MARKPDDTVILRPAPAVRAEEPQAVAARGRSPWMWVVGIALAVVGAGVATWALQTPASVSSPAVVAVDPAPEAIPLATEAAIRAESPAVRTVLRFAENPAVVVIDFPTLAEQGRMFNRVAAWAEKAGVAHDRVPSEETTAAAIAASQSTADNYYYGHDYSGAALGRFFALAEAGSVSLRPEEAALRRITARAAAETAGLGAVITVVRADEANGVSAQARATILHHELSHGEYFTNPAYAAFVQTIWDTVMTAPERAAFRTYLAQEGYDPGLEDLMRNEMQAYLMHTADPAFFQPARLGIAPARLAQIRQAFLAGMPAGWLRDAVVASGIAGPAERPRRRRDRPQGGAGRVSMGRAVAATVPPRRRRASAAV